MMWSFWSSDFIHIISQIRENHDQSDYEFNDTSIFVILVHDLSDRKVIWSSLSSIYIEPVNDIGEGRTELSLNRPEKKEDL